MRIDEMKNKIIATIFFLCVLCPAGLNAQRVSSDLSESFTQSVEVAAANRRTAERCLKSAENGLKNEEWNTAFSQSELGLVYDSSVSDLWYINALAKSCLNYKRADILKTVEKAISLDNWINYNRNGGRILYADCLSETGRYDESLKVLDENPFIYSADAEFIRIKNYYRMGTADSIVQARTKINAVRKIYPFDKRFPQVFFLFEMLFMNYTELSGASYEIPEFVKSIANDYIQKLPDYDSKDVETEVMALMFASGEQQTRLLKAIGEKNSSIPLFALAGLKAGILSEEKAYNLFFEFSDDVFYLNILETFAHLIRNEGLRQNLSDRLNSFTGTIYIDDNLDSRVELEVQYERGRPVLVKYDYDTDDVFELRGTCDFGVPNHLLFENTNLSLEYEKYPAVKSIVSRDGSICFYFLDNDFLFVPFEMSLDKMLSSEGVTFFIPYVNREISVPDENDLAKKASCIEIKTAEREHSKVSYSVYGGQPVNAVFNNGSVRYAYSTIEPGCPFVRHLDSDGDGYYETMETYDLADEEGFVSDESKILTKRVFGENAFSSNLYLKSVEIDSNGNNTIEFKEEYLQNNGKRTFWDNDDDGIWDTGYIRYSDGEAVTEESIFFNKGLKSVYVKSKDGKPVSIFYSGKEHPVLPGIKNSYYWIEKEGEGDCEDLIEHTVKNGLENGTVKLVEYNKDERLLVIRIDGSIYCRLVSASEEELEKK